MLCKYRCNINVSTMYFHSIYSESSVIRTSMIRILDYPDNKIPLLMTYRLCNYRTNAHTLYK